MSESAVFGASMGSSSRVPMTSSRESSGHISEITELMDVDSVETIGVDCNILNNNLDGHISSSRLRKESVSSDSTGTNGSNNSSSINSLSNGCGHETEKESDNSLH